MRQDIENVRLSDFDQGYPRFKATAFLGTKTIVKLTIGAFEQYIDCVDIVVPDLVASYLNQLADDLQGSSNDIFSGQLLDVRGRGSLMTLIMLFVGRL